VQKEGPKLDRDRVKLLTTNSLVEGEGWGLNDPHQQPKRLVPW